MLCIRYIAGAHFVLNREKYFLENIRVIRLKFTTAALFMWSNQFRFANDFTSTNSFALGHENLFKNIRVLCEIVRYNNNTTKTHSVTAVKFEHQLNESNGLKIYGPELVFVRVMHDHTIMYGTIHMQRFRRTALGDEFSVDSLYLFS